MNNMKEQADKLLYDLGLFDELKKYGTPQIIGSYAMNVMAWNDLDIDVTNEDMDIEKLYSLTSVILKKYKPIWYEAKQELTSEGKQVWFHGFETMILGDLWNIDIWFFDKSTISNAESFCDNVKKQIDLDENKRNTIIQIKKGLIEKELYSFEKYTSMDVYKAVLEDGISSLDEFLIRCKK